MAKTYQVKKLDERMPIKNGGARRGPGCTGTRSEIKALDKELGVGKSVPTPGE